MFAKISCPRCHLSSLWTDDPERFLRDVCQHPGDCQGEVLHEALAGSLPSSAGCVDLLATEVFPSRPAKQA